MAQIELENIARTFSLGNAKVCALSTINLAIEKGEYVAIMGPSGSGKSTLLNLLGLLDRPDAGRYRLEGRDVTTLSSDELAAVRRQRIGFIFQSFHLIPRLTAAENIALPLVLAGAPPAVREKQVHSALAKVGLQSRAGHRPDELSGGQRQRIAIARAIIMRPAMLLADEPTGNLDRHTGREVTELLEGLNTAGTTLIIVTHDLVLGRRARRRLLMVDGVLTDGKSEAADGPPPALPAPMEQQRGGMQ
ncbi:MAG: ABC transporter ATP-binding protein [Azoarcus sp.]|jgi:putative ABC transport system ATP-binding protein|nr:ABC transporter ATP-binding protein [Azoarcus sp.]